jgi:hypothetical protein
LATNNDPLPIFPQMQSVKARESKSPDPSTFPQPPSNGEPVQQPPRRSSFNFLRRQKSIELRGRSTSNGRLSKKQKALAEQERLRQQSEAGAVPKQPPRLPSHSPLPQIITFGGENAKSEPITMNPARLAPYSNQPWNNNGMASSPPHNVPLPPVPGSSPGSPDWVDPYARTESMTHRGRYSYASSAVSTLNTPRRVRRRKDPTPFK